MRRWPIRVLALSACLTVAAAGTEAAAGASQGIPHAKGNPYKLAQPGVLHLAADFSVPPNQFIRKGKYAGIDVDLCTAIAAQLHLKIEWTNLAFDSLIPGLEAHRFDALCTGVFITKAREQVMNMIPYVRWGVTMGVQKSTVGKYQCKPKHGNYLPCFQKFAGQTVSTETGGFEEQLLQTANKQLQAKGLAPMKILGFAQTTQAFQAFTNGTASGVWVDDPQFAFFNKNNGSKYVAAFGRDELTPLALTTTKANVALARGLQRGLNRIKANGEYARILKKWDVSAVPRFAINPPAK